MFIFPPLGHLINCERSRRDPDKRARTLEDEPGKASGVISRHGGVRERGVRERRVGWGEGDRVAHRKAVERKWERIWTPLVIWTPLAVWTPLDSRELQHRRAVQRLNVPGGKVGTYTITPTITPITCDKSLHSNHSRFLCVRGLYIYI